MKYNSLISCLTQDSGDQEYYTPYDIVEAARNTLGEIDLDPASCEEANELVRAKQYFTKEDNGLLKDWHGRVWMNHPFSKKNNPLFVNKLVHEYLSGRVTAACCITFASTSEKWFKPLLYRPQCFLIGRTNFIKPGGITTNEVLKGCVVTYFGNHVDKFKESFKHLGVVKGVI